MKEVYRVMNIEKETKNNKYIHRKQGNDIGEKERI